MTEKSKRSEALSIWMPMCLAVPPAVAGVMEILDRLKLTPIYTVLVSTLTVAALFLFMLGLWWFLRRLDRYMVALILLAFSAGIVLAGGRWVPPPPVPTSVASDAIGKPTASVSTVTITWPQNNVVVESRVIARGTVDDLNATVWVIVHPMSAGGYFVQQPAMPRQDGIWAASVCLGSSDRIELVAVANPLGVMKPGLVLSNWPAAQAKSPVVEVVHYAKPAK
jgi:hypothetical protein